MINIKINDAKLKPTKGTEGSGGFDLYLSHDSSVSPGETAMIGTGVHIAIPYGFIGLILPRSSTGKMNLKLANTAGVIDSDYRGEVMLPVQNTGRQLTLLYKYDRLFQLIIVPVYSGELTEVEDLEPSDRGTGGFGSTGT